MLEQDMIPHLAKMLALKTSHIESAVKLLDEGNTVPFIARYRKEATDEMKDEQLRTLQEKLASLRNLLKRQEEIRSAITEQGKMTKQISDAISKVEKLQGLEDIYLPTNRKSAPAL